MTRASEAAIQAATYVMLGPIEAAIEAAHDPALGLDRSVCLRDVVDAVGSLSPAAIADLLSMTDEEVCVEDLGDVFAGLIERTFTASSSSEGSPDGD